MLRDNSEEHTFISFSDVSAVAELKGKAIGNCLAKIEPIITPQYVMYRIPTKEIEKALRNPTVKSTTKTTGTTTTRVSPTISLF